MNKFPKIIILLLCLASFGFGAALLPTWNYFSSEEASEIVDIIRSDFDADTTVKFQTIMLHDVEGNRCFLSANSEGLVTQCFPAP